MTSTNDNVYTSDSNSNSSTGSLPTKKELVYRNPISTFYPQEHDNTIMPQQSTLLIRIDNLPPRKNWKQVKYLVGGIMHHSNILQVKLLPPMTSVVPPFITMQSCIVIVKNTLSQDTINDLLLTLNSYQWDYHDLFAYITPQIPINQFNPNLQLNPTTDKENINSQTNYPQLKPSIYQPHYSVQYPMPYTAQTGINQLASLPVALGAAGPNNTNLNTPSPSTALNSNLNNFNSPYGMFPTMAPNQNPYPFGFPQPFQQRRHFYHQPTLPKYNTSGPNNLPFISGFDRESLSSDEQISSNAIDSENIAYLTNKKNLNPFKQPKTLKSIFNEKNFRKQMTDRGMWQLKLDNFPPYLITDSLLEVKNNEENEIEASSKIDIISDSIDKYGKLRWTVLKDFVKLKCPRLLNLQDSTIPEMNSDNTREFYVGVYENYDKKLTIKINEKIYSVDAIFFNAIIGFHDKALCDSCLKALKDQEYSLGYILEIQVLPPYDVDVPKTEQTIGVQEENPKKLEDGEQKIASD